MDGKHRHDSKRWQNTYIFGQALRYYVAVAADMIHHISCKEEEGEGDKNITGY